MNTSKKGSALPEHFQEGQHHTYTPPKVQHFTWMPPKWQHFTWTPPEGATPYLYISKGQHFTERFQECKALPKHFQEGKALPKHFQESKALPKHFQEGKALPKHFQEGKALPKHFQVGKALPKHFQEGKALPKHFQEGQHLTWTPPRGATPYLNTSKTARMVPSISPWMNFPSTSDTFRAQMKRRMKSSTMAK